MAERRMFAKTIIDSDAFLDMPQSSQNLYFHLSMRADDDGFINNPKKIARMIGCNEDDLKLLLMKRFVLGFESGVIVIKHWKIHNYIRGDRYKETVYTDEKNQLLIKDNGGYTFAKDEEVVKVIEEKPKTKNFVKPTIEDVQDYCNERGNKVDAQYFVDYYDGNGWMVGRSKMKDWKATVRRWEKNSFGVVHNKSERPDVLPTWYVENDVKSQPTLSDKERKEMADKIKRGMM